MHESELGFVWDVEEYEHSDGILIDLGDRVVHLTHDDLIDMLKAIGGE